MRLIVSFIAMCLVVSPVAAADGSLTARGGRSVSAQAARGRMPSMPVMSVGGNMVMDLPDVSVSGGNQQVPGQPGGEGNPSKPDVPDAPVVPDDTETVLPEPEVPEVDMREKERLACVSNNIGVGNTFVWASRYSNVDNYASMVEDINEPLNNTCFVKVEVKSNDPKVSVYDVPSKYFEMGRNITCGSWADEAALTQRILDAKKSARTWGTIGGAVGGAGLGVGMMELFGNDLIGGKVLGQEAMEGNELLKSQMLTLKDKDRAGYNEFVRTMKEFIADCQNPVWQSETAPAECDRASDYSALLKMVGEEI